MPFDDGHKNDGGRRRRCRSKEVIGQFMEMKSTSATKTNMNGQMFATSLGGIF